MQPARIKLHAKEHTSNPVQRPNFRGHALLEVVDEGRKFLRPTLGNPLRRKA
jgi:hypothetical protein